jgi:tRNA 2-thiouridine synthesizing protein A
MSIHDFRGLKCPIPVLKAYKVIKEEKETSEFLFLTDDVSAPRDFKEFCNNTGYIFVGVTKKKNYSEIKVGNPNPEK